MNFDHPSFHHSNRSSLTSVPGQYNGNRSRCNTGDSTYSNSIGTGDLAASANPQTTRRRSHRPRGCRGGRKNRKSQQAKAAALIPKEILDDTPGPLSPRVGNVQQQKKNLTQGKIERQEGSKMSASESRSLPWKEQVQKQPQQPKIWTKTGEDVAGGLPFMSHQNGMSSAMYSSRPSTTPPRAKLDKSNGVSNPGNGSYQTYGYGVQTSTSNHPNFFRPVRPDYTVDATLQFPNNNDYNKQLHLSFMTNRRPSAQVETSSTTHPPLCDILPPLPSGSFSSRESPPLPFMGGPNPYALSVSIDGPMALETLFGSGFPNCRSTDSLNHKLSTDVGKAHSYPGMGGYRNQRIQKQRQMLASGGSLFVTSPRSFLLGATS